MGCGGMVVKRMVGDGGCSESGEKVQEEIIQKAPHFYL